MPADPPRAQACTSRSLAVVAEDLRAANEVVRELRRGLILRERLLAAHQCLLTARELYTAELIARGLPVPPKLHGALRLQRPIAGGGDRAR